MTERDIVRRLLRRITTGVPATSARANALLEWAEPHRAWLTGSDEGNALDWSTLLAAIDAGAAAEMPPHALLLTERLAALLALEPFDAALLQLVVASDRLPRVAALMKLAGKHGHDLPALLGELAGADAHDATAPCDAVPCSSSVSSASMPID